MQFNYFVAYDLNFPGQNYDAVIERIKSLGTYAHMQMSLFYLKTDLAMVDVHNSIREVMDTNDKLAIIWARDAYVSAYHPSNLATLQLAFADQL